MRRRHVSVALLGAVFATLLVIAPDVVLLIFAGILFAVFLNGSGGWLARKCRIRRGAGVALFTIGLVLVLAGAITAFAPTMTEQFEDLSTQVPEAARSLRERLEEYSWGRRLVDGVSPARVISDRGPAAAATAVSSTLGVLGNTALIIVIGLYGAIAPSVYRRGFIALMAPSLRPRAAQVLDRVVETLRNWLAAKAISMAVVGVLTWAGLAIVGVPLAFLLGLIAALLAFIPNIGPILSAVPAVLLAIPEGATTTLLVIGVYVVVQTVESYVITPLVQQEKVSLPPALVLSAQLLLGVLFGLIGLALATPLTALTMTLIREVYVHDYLGREALTHGVEPGMERAGDD